MPLCFLPDPPENELLSALVFCRPDGGKAFGTQALEKILLVKIASAKQIWYISEMRLSLP